MSPKPLIIAHRGFSGKYPENTLLAVREAMRLGVDGIEVDARVSRDGVVVLMHDESVERTTNGRGLVRELLWSEIKRLDAGSWRGEEFLGEPVPTLDEILAETVGRVVLHVEVKEPGDEDAVIKVARDVGALDWIVVNSFHPEVIRNVLKLEPTLGRCLTLEWLDDDFEESRAIRLAINHGANSISLYKGRATQSFMKYAHQRLLSVSVWTVNSIEDARSLAKMDVDAIVTDYPDIMLNYLRGASI